MKALHSPTFADVPVRRRHWMSLGGALGLLGVSGMLACVIEPSWPAVGIALGCLLAAVACIGCAVRRRLEWIEAPRPETSEDACHE